MNIAIKELEMQRDSLTAQINSYYRNQVQQIINQNKGFIGKTFKKDIIQNKEKRTKYCKIIDVDSQNQYRMKTLCFNLPINTSEEDILMDIDNIGWFCNTLSGNTMLKEVDTYTEITSNEFDKSFDEFINIIKREYDI